ncbi:MAG: helix-turn-helix transcriptional regulator [Crocinitomicaceae bacterium]
MTKTIIAKNFKKLRLFKSMNQTEFAELFDITRSTVGSYEEGRAEPKLDTLMKVADHFKLKVDDIIRKELTVNKIANFEYPVPEAKNLKDLNGRLESMNKRLDNIERLLQPKKS